MSYLEDYEKRLLFSAFYREKKICEKIDKECTGKIKLKPIVESLERKFYYDKFEKEIRNKAIDEFVERIKKYKFHSTERYENCVAVSNIDWLAEQMKGE